MTLACAAAAAAAEVEESDSHLANNGLLTRAVVPEDNIFIRVDEVIFSTD